jgi:hypothetical protein
MTKSGKIIATATRVANIALLIGAGVAVLTFFYFFYHYTLVGDREFISAAYMFVYYGVPLVLASFLLLFLRLSPDYRINLVLLLTISLFCLYGVEALLHWRSSALYAGTMPVMSNLAQSVDKSADAAALKKEWGLEIDTRSGYEVIRDLRNQNVTAVPIITPANSLFVPQPDGSIKSAITIDGQEVIPLGGVSNSFTVLCNELGEWIFSHSDRHGFSNPQESWRTEPLDIAAIGDSFTYGYCVPEDKNFVALIRHRYPKTLNLGMAGDGPLLMLATLTEYLPQLRPRTVLWFYFEGNDLVDLQAERKSLLLQQYLHDGFTQPALTRQEEIDRAMLADVPREKALDEDNRATARARGKSLTGQINDVIRLSSLRQDLGLVGGSAVDEDFTGPNMEAFRGVLSRAKERVDSWGGDLVFVYLPDWARYAHYDRPGVAVRDEVLASVRRLGIPVIDVIPAFESHGDPLSLFPFHRPPHYTVTGHRLVAESVIDALARRIN